MAKEIQHIIKACLQFDATAQKKLYDLSVDRLYFTVSRYINDNFFVENVLQDVFIRIFNQLDKYNATKGAFSTWSGTIAIRVSLNFLRKKRLAFVPIENDHLDFIGHLDPMLSKMEIDELFQLIRSIPEKYQIIFMLYEVDGYVHKEIAEMLEITEGTSRSYLARAKKLIQEKIGFCVN